MTPGRSPLCERSVLAEARVWESCPPSELPSQHWHEQQHHHWSKELQLFRIYEQRLQTSTCKDSTTIKLGTYYLQSTTDFSQQELKEKNKPWETQARLLFFWHHASLISTSILRIRPFVLRHFPFRICSWNRVDRGLTYQLVWSNLCLIDERKTRNAATTNLVRMELLREESLRRSLTIAFVAQKPRTGPSQTLV